MRLLFSLVFIGLFVSPVTAQVKWDGEGDGISWNDADNWVGDVVPGPTDDVVLDNSAPGATSLYDVYLPNTAVIIKSLTINPNSGILITLYLPSTNTIESDAFVITGSGYSVMINSGGTFVNNANVNSGTNLTISDSIRINNGGYYKHATRSNVYPWITKLSKASNTEEGVFAFAVPYSSYSVSLGGLTFGTLNFTPYNDNSPSIVYSISGSDNLNIQGDFNIASITTPSFVTINTTVNASLQNDVVVKGTFFVNPGTTLNLQSSSYNNVFKIAGGIFFVGGMIYKTGSGIPQIQLNGVSFQNVYVDGNIFDNVEFHINKPTGNVTLSTPVTLPYKLTLTKGKIITTAANILTLADDATSSGGSTLSFVQGPMRKIGDDDFIFPIGLGGIYAPLGITNVSGESSTDEFTAEYKRANPQSTSLYGSGVGSGLNHVSYVEYWTLTQGLSTTSSKKVSLDVHATSFCKNLAHTYICRWDGMIWNKENTNSPMPFFNGSYETGIITTANGLTDFTAPGGNAFTLGTDLNFIQNPLPVNLISFSAKKVNDNSSLIEWELAECCSSTVTFEVERAADDRTFKAIEIISGDETDRFYSVTDNKLPSGTSFYRLKITDENGAISYSKTVAVINGAKTLQMSLAPTVVTDRFLLAFSSAISRPLDIFITDMQGKIIRRIHQLAVAGNFNLPVMVNDLTPGVYHIIAVAGNERANTLRFIRK